MHLHSLLADIIISDDDEGFQQYVIKFREADPTHQSMSLVSIKQQRLCAELNAWLGISRNANGTRSLGIQDTQLDQCVATSDPVHFWQFDVPTGKCFIRGAAMRVLCAKPSSTAVERLWSHFRDTFTRKRRSLLSATLHRTVYTKMNMHLLPHAMLDQVDNQNDLHDAVQSDFDWVSSILDEDCEHDKDLERLHEGRQVAGVQSNDGNSNVVCLSDPDVVQSEVDDVEDDDVGFILD